MALFVGLCFAYYVTKPFPIIRNTFLFSAIIAFIWFASIVVEEYFKKH